MPARSAAGHNQSSVPSVGPGLHARFVEIEPQAKHAGPVLPGGDEVPALRPIEVEPAENGETVGMCTHRFDRQFIRVRVPT